MVRKHSSSSKVSEPSRIDDLKLINGIGPGVEKRLNSIGIYTYSQLAALSPADIAASLANLSGLSTERIIKQDWVGQARRLALEASVSIASEAQEAQKEVKTQVNDEEPLTTADQQSQPAPSDKEGASNNPAILTLETQQDALLKQAYRATTFTVELLLDGNNHVHSTQVTHIQSRREQTWTGFQKEELIDFLGQNAGASFSPVESAHAEAKEPERAVPVKEKPSLAGKVHLRNLDIIGVEAFGDLRTIEQDMTVKGHLTLDLSELMVPGDTPLNYKAAIYGKRRGSSSGTVVGEAQGSIIPKDTITIPVEGNMLPEGTYRLAATVILALPGTKPTAKPGLIATVEGGQLQVV
jgi:hypothetical protein